MLRIFQNAKRLISVCLATLLIVVSTITIFPSTASADNNFIKNEIKIECPSNCGNIFSFAVGMVSGSVVTLMATADGTILATTSAAITQTALAALATLGTATTTFVSAPVLVPVAATLAVGTAGAYVVSQIVNNDNHSQNAN